MSDLTRKLATIVALDVAGYSARTEADEARTTAEVAALRKVIEAIAAKHGGRVFNTAGDGFMLEFGSSLSAFEAAFEFAETCEPKVRVGVHVGDVMVQPNGDLLGHGVNVAARLMAKSAPGAFLVSGTARQTMRGPLADRLVSRGIVQLDKMAETIEVFAIGETATPTVAAAPAAALNGRIPRVAAMIGGSLLLTLVVAIVVWRQADAPGLSEPAAESIAVLPFENLSADKDNAFFTAGIQDEILTRLSKIGALKVISRTSTAKYASRPENLTDIAKELGVTNILEGSVQRQGNDVRVNVQLIKASTDGHVWAEVYDRKLDNIFSVQSEIAISIAQALSARVTGDEKREITVRPTAIPEAYDAYLRGLGFTRSLQHQQAQQAFQTAVRLDPGFALAWAMLSKVAARQVYSVGHVDERVSIARTALDAAVRLQPELTEVILAQAYYRYWVDDDPQGARVSFESVNAKWPNNIDALTALGYIARRQGHWDEAMAYLDHAAALDPRSFEVRMAVVQTLIVTREFEAAQAAATEALTIWPDDPVLRGLSATALQALGRLEQSGDILKTIQADDFGGLSAVSAQAIYTRRFADGIWAAQAFWAHAVDVGNKDRIVEGVVNVTLGDLRRLAGDTTGAKSNYVRARDILLEALRRQVNDAPVTSMLSLAYCGLEERETAEKYADQAVTLLPTDRDALDGPGFELNRARIWARFGDRDRAIPELARLARVKGLWSPLTPEIFRLDPDFDKLRGDPRFLVLLKSDPSIK